MLSFSEKRALSLFLYLCTLSPQGTGGGVGTWVLAGYVPLAS